MLLCPGGQAELVYADRAFAPRGTAAAATAAAFAAGSPVLAAPAAPSVAVSSSAAVLGKEPEDPASTENPLKAGRGATTVSADASATAAAPAAGRLSMVRQPQARHQLVIYAGHQGFVRLSLEEGAWLVPVLALGEVLQVRHAHKTKTRRTLLWFRKSVSQFFLCSLFLFGRMRSSCCRRTPSSTA